MGYDSLQLSRTGFVLCQLETSWLKVRHVALQLVCPLIVKDDPMNIIATTQYRLKTLTLRQDTLVLILSGEKQVISPEATLRCLPAQALLLAKGTQWDVINDPARCVRYEAICVPFDGDVLVRASRATQTSSLKRVHSAEAFYADDELQEAIGRLDPDRFRRRISTVVREHRALELLLLLAERGFYFEPYEDLSWTEKVSRLVAQRPAANWNVENIAAAFHMSASSLRRRLDGEQLTAAAIVRDVRLEIALSLLQKGDHSIGEVAQMCGWESHSRFTAMFHKRWGVLPSVVRANLEESGQNLVAIG